MKYNVDIEVPSIKSSIVYSFLEDEMHYLRLLRGGLLGSTEMSVLRGELPAETSFSASSPEFALFWLEYSSIGVNRGGVFSEIIHNIQM